MYVLLITLTWYSQLKNVLFLFLLFLQCRGIELFKLKELIYSKWILVLVFSNRINSYDEIWSGLKFNTSIEIIIQFMKTRKLKPYKIN